MSKSPSLRRIQADIRELALDPSDRYHAAPLENDMFEWHFTIRGAEATDFEGGVYHGRILLPPEYPFKPPHILFLTPSGRFETNTKVCLSFSAFHPELWQPAWGIRLILEALISFLPTATDGAIGALDWSKEERKRLAKLSQSYCCPICGKCVDLLPQLRNGGNDDAKKTPASGRFAKEIAELQRLQQEAERNKKPGVRTAAECQEESKTEVLPSCGGTIEESYEISPNTGTAADAAAAFVAPSTLAESISQEAPEEEVVFDDTTFTNTMDSATNLTELTDNAAKEDPKEQDDMFSGAAATSPENSIADVGEPQAQNHGAFPVLEDDPSWMYDPLMNVMMVLLAVICFLLIQKYQDLMQELYELQQLSDLSE